MKLEDILTLAKAGFNAEDIAKLAQAVDQPAPAPAPAPAPDPVPDTVPAPAPAPTAGFDMDEFFKRFQAANLQQPAPAQEARTPELILGRIIDPNYKKE